MTMEEMDAIAVTYGPGLIGSLLVGVDAAKTLAYLYQKPLIPEMCIRDRLLPLN